MAKGRGKPCGASHISANKKCRVGLPPRTQDALNETVKKLSIERVQSVPGSLKRELEALAARDQQLKDPKEGTSLAAIRKQYPGLNSGAANMVLEARRKIAADPDNPLYELNLPSAREEGSLVRDKNTGASTNTRWHRQDAKDFDGDFKPTEQFGKKGYDWSDSYGSGTKQLGAGSYGQVMKAEGPPPVAVKRGDIGVNEPKLVDKVGKADLGPRLVSAQLDTRFGTNTAGGGSVEIANGRMAMTIVPGHDLEGWSSGDRVGNTTVGDAFWKARADLHRLGIAHNDMHTGNVFVDEKGKGRFVDMGMAQDNPKAALAEALGAFEPSGSVRAAAGAGVVGGSDRGDWQVKRWSEATGVDSARPGRGPRTYRTIDTNKERLLARLEREGFSPAEIGHILGDGIRNSEEFYNNGVWSNISNEMARSYIQDLYEGV